MKDQSWTISGKAALELIGLGLAGQMTVETFTELAENLSHSPSNARTTAATTSPDGSRNSTPRLPTMEEFLGVSYTSGMELLMHQRSTPLSHSGCWCDSSERLDTNNA